jgi:hypothetical protein
MIYKVLLFSLISFSCFSQMIVTDAKLYEEIPARPVNLTENKETVFYVPANTDYQGLYFKIPNPACEDCHIRVTYEKAFLYDLGVLSGTWGTHSNTTFTTDFRDNDFKYTYDVNATLTFTFTGRRIQWFSEKRNNHGIVSVKITGELDATVDLYAATTANASVMVYDMAWDTAGTRTITIKLTGAKNPLATEVSMVHDYFRVTR